MNMINKKIPKEVKAIIKKLQSAGFKAYIVGGCVRDLLRSAEPNDWDVATNARPEQIVKIFPKNFQDNDFGMVTILTGSKKQNLREIQIMPYRSESKYSDKRHPDKTSWVETIEQDLSRRDFTVNALAMSEVQEKIDIIDLFGGQKDIKDKIIRAVGDPNERFDEDALRMMRAARFAVTLGKGWQIEKNTEKAIKKNARNLQVISKERVRDELMKIILSPDGDKGIELLRILGLLKYVIPELEEGYGVSQNKHHIYDCYEHNLKSFAYAVEKDYNQYVRLAALLHDIGKPRTKRGEGPDSTFYNHEIVGARMARILLNRLKFPRKDIRKIVKLVRYHLFYYNVGEVSESSVRRLLKNVGSENIDELLQVRYCDRIGSGCPKAEPYKLRHLRYVLEKVSQDPVSVVNLKISGNDIMNCLKISPGPKIGEILDILLSGVLEDPARNKKTSLKARVKELGKLEDERLEKLATSARKQITEIETKRDEMTKKKYWVT